MSRTILGAQAQTIIDSLKAKNPNDPAISRLTHLTVLAPPIQPPPIIPPSIIPPTTLTSNPNLPSVVTPVPAGRAMIGIVAPVPPPKRPLDWLGPRSIADIRFRARNGTVPDEELAILRNTLTPEAYGELFQQGRTGPGPTGGGILSGLTEYKNLPGAALPLGPGSLGSIPSKPPSPLLAQGGFYSTPAGPPMATGRPTVLLPAGPLSSAFPTWFLNTGREVSGPSRTLTPTIPPATTPFTEDAPPLSTTVITPVGQGPPLTTDEKRGAPSLTRAAKVGAGVAVAEQFGFKSGHAVGLGGLAGAYTYAADYLGSGYLPTVVDPKTDRSLVVGLLGIVGNKYYNTDRNPIYSFLEFSGIDWAVRQSE